MSAIVKATCTEPQFLRINERMAELQAKDPGHTYQGHEALDDLIHHGHMLTRLPADEIQAVVTRANEVING